MPARPPRAAGRSSRFAHRETPAPPPATMIRHIPGIRVVRTQQLQSTARCWKVPLPTIRQRPAHPAEPAGLEQVTAQSSVRVRRHGRNLSREPSKKSPLGTRFAATSVCLSAEGTAMADQKPANVHVDECGIVRVGGAGVPLEEIATSYQKGHSLDAILARFPALTREELRTALAQAPAAHTDGVPRGPQQRDAQWKRWNATLAEDTGTDVPPNQPIAERSAPPAASQAEAQ